MACYAVPTWEFSSQVEVFFLPAEMHPTQMTCQGIMRSLYQCDIINNELIPIIQGKKKRLDKSKLDFDVPTELCLCNILLTSATPNAQEIPSQPSQAQGRLSGVVTHLLKLNDLKKPIYYIPLLLWPR